MIYLQQVNAYIHIVASHSVVSTTDPIRLNTKKTNAVTIPIIISINIGCSVSLKLFQLQAQQACQSNIGSTIHYTELCIAYGLWLNYTNVYACVHTCLPYYGVVSAKWNGKTL